MHADGRQRLHFGDGVLYIMKQLAFSQLQLETFRGRTGLLQRAFHLVHEIGLPKLAGAQVDGQRPLRTHLIVLPGGKRGASLLQHPLPQQQNKARLLGQMNELCGRNHAAGRVVPAKQALHPLNAPATVHNGLTEQSEMALAQTVSHFPLQGGAFHRPILQGGIKKAHGIAACRLGFVHRQVRTAEDVFHAFFGPTEKGDSDTGCGSHFIGIHRERRLQGRTDFFANRFGHQGRLLSIV